MFVCGLQAFGSRATGFPRQVIPKLGLNPSSRTASVFLFQFRTCATLLPWIVSCSTPFHLVAPNHFTPKRPSSHTLMSIVLSYEAAQGYKLAFTACIRAGTISSHRHPLDTGGAADCSGDMFSCSIKLAYSPARQGWIGVQAWSCMNPTTPNIATPNVAKPNTVAPTMAVPDIATPNIGTFHAASYTALFLLQ